MGQLDLRRAPSRRPQMSLHKLRRATILVVGRIEQAFTQRGIYLRNNVPSDLALAALLRHACGTTRAISSLAKGGYGSGALALSRSVADVMITVRWITNKETEKRAEQFLVFDSKQRERIIELLEKHYPLVDLTRFRGNERHERQASMFKKWGNFGVTTRDMALEDEVLEPESDNQRRTEWTYDVSFFTASNHLHPTSLGIRHHCFWPGPRFNFEKVEDEEKFAHQGLVNAVFGLSSTAAR